MRVVAARVPWGPALLSGLLSASLLLSGCARAPSGAVLADLSVPQANKLGIEALHAGDYPEARRYFASILRHDPMNCKANFLNGLAYQLQGTNNEELQSYASVGYSLASKSCPQDPWPYYYGGVMAFQQKNYPLAEQLFDNAYAYADKQLKLRFARPLMLAAYDNGNDALVKRLANSLLKINTDQVFANAILKAVHDHPIYLADLGASADVGVSAAQPAGQDVGQSLGVGAGQNVGSAAGTSAGENAGQSSPPYTAPPPWPSTQPAISTKQVMIDALVVLDRQEKFINRGVNLLRGLTFQYGNGEVPGFLATFNGVRMADWSQYMAAAGSKASASQIPFSRIITNTISIHGL